MQSNTAEDEEIARETDRMSRLLSKKSSERFEQKRRDTLKQYQAQTGKTSFELPDEPAPIRTSAPIVTNATVFNWREQQESREREEEARKEEERIRRMEKSKEGIEFDNHITVQPMSWREQQENREREERQRKEEEERRRLERSKESVGLDPTMRSPLTRGTSWRDQKDIKEREERQRKEEEERRRQEKSRESVGLEPSPRRASISGTTSWREQKEIKEREERERKEDEERRRQERAKEVAGSSEELEYKQQSQYKELQLRLKLEEDERKKYELTKAILICSQCGGKFDSLDTKKIKGIVYCMNCTPKVNTSLYPLCTTCGQPLYSTIATAMGKKYHPECLICGGCGSVLTTGFRSAFNKLWCLECKPSQQ